VDNQSLDLLQSFFEARFNTLDKRFDASEDRDETQLELLHCIDRKVAVNATNIAWVKWSLRGTWLAFFGVGGYFRFG